MNTVYLKTREASVGDNKAMFGVGFISIRLARVMLKKVLCGEWKITQVPSTPVENMFGFREYVPAFTSPTTKSVLFIKSGKPGIFVGTRMVKLQGGCQ